MTLPRLNSLTGYWADNPPEHISTSTILHALTGAPKRSKSKDGYVPQDIPMDTNGNPTKDIPTTLEHAARLAGGSVIRPPRSRFRG
jgi:hypothetical protein